MHDPYAVPGRWVKGQLHAHTTRSDGRLSPDEVLAAYRGLGFAFLSLTDHDRLQPSCQVSGGLLLVPGEESTVTRTPVPLGPHLLRLFVRRELPAPRMPLAERLAATAGEGGLAAACHPAWPGNFGTGRWQLGALLDPRLTLLEIVNHHSPVEASLRLWDQALVERGPDRPLWALAVDDSHRAEEIGRAWVQVKLPEGPQAETGAWMGYGSADAACEALRDALARGAFYATTGPEVEFRVMALASPDGEGVRPAITARAEAPLTIRFLGPGCRLLGEQQGPHGTFWPRGDEGFVRVEVTDARGGRAWSQPFWIRPAAPA